MGQGVARLALHPTTPTKALFPSSPDQGSAPLSSGGGEGGGTRGCGSIRRQWREVRIQDSYIGQ